jgi:methyl-accepting chemotaxis protein
LSTYLPDYTSEILNCTTSTFAGITRVRNDVSGLSAQIHDIHSSLPELKNDTREIAQTIEQMLPSIQQSSTRIATDLTRVDRSVSTLNQQISTLGSGLEQNFSILGQTIDRLPGVLEDKILTMLEVYFNRQAHSIASKCSSVDTMV